MKYIVLTISLTASFLAQSASEKAVSLRIRQRNPDRRTHIFSGAQFIEKGEKTGTAFHEADREKFKDIEKLVHAIYKNDPSAFTQLQQSGIDPNWCYAKFGCSPLCMAVQNGAYNIVDLLITQGIADVYENIDATFKHDTVLCATYRKVRHYREEYGFDAMRKVIERLVLAGADVLAPGASDATPLSLFAACSVIPNKHAFPILQTLLSALPNNTAAAQARSDAVSCAEKQAELDGQQCAQHGAMLQARAQFIERYNSNHAQDQSFDLQQDCDIWPIEQPKSYGTPAGDSINIDEFTVDNFVETKDGWIEKKSST